MTTRLSKRCREVLGYVFMGKTNDEIGAILGVAKPTVKNHLRRIIGGLGAYNRQNAVYLALKAGILQPPQPESPPVAPPPAPVAAPTADDWLSAGNVHLSSALRIVMANNRVLPIAGVRFRLMAALLQRPGFALTRQQLLDHTHGERAVEERTIDVHVTRLRMTLRDAGADHYIHAERGIGYRLGPVLLHADQ